MVPPKIIEQNQDASTSMNELDASRLESYWGNEYEGVHLYMSGEVLILSSDLLHCVVSEVPYSKTRIAPGGYIEGNDDGHDISGMVFHCPTPVHLFNPCQITAILGVLPRP